MIIDIMMMITMREMTMLIIIRINDYDSKRILNDDDLADQQAFYYELSKLTGDF